MLSGRPLVSVLIPSHNYARYLAIAIESALEQTYPHLEVVVVDDGSDDCSREVMRSYGDRIVARYKDRGGQVSALNMAFAQSHGDIVCLLDADDIFLPSKVEQLVSAWQGRPDAFLAHHQAQIIDATGRRLHAPYPRHVVDGDRRAKGLRSAGWFPHAPSGALAFARDYARRLFPVPAQQPVSRSVDGSSTIAVEVDTYLAGPAALLAPVVGIPEPLLLRRIHGANRIATTDLAPNQTAEQHIARYEAETETLIRVMRDRFAREVLLDARQHLDLQLARCAAGQVSRAATARRVLASPALPARTRPREALRVLARRGPAGRGPVFPLTLHGRVARR